ncbi:MAG: glycoside hydrolase family 5 protein [Gemmatimonadaceae bacterium]
MYALVLHRRLRRRRRAAVAFAIAAAIAVAIPACVPASWLGTTSGRYVGSAVPDARFARLGRGVNLSHWFTVAPEDTARLDPLAGGYATVEDFRKIRRMGFRHVRLPFSPEPIFHEDDPERLDGPYLAALDRAVDAILAESLAVIVDMHPEQGGAFKKRLAGDDAHVRRVARFWGALARHFATRDPEHLFLEVMNESEVRDRERWDWVQRKLLHAMRDGAPRHTLIATGARWGSVKDLTRLEPVDDPNVVYDFHFYDPYEFTHQGATWAVSEWRDLRELPYPASVPGVVPALGDIRTTSAKVTALRYGNSGWNADRLAEKLGDVVEWSDRHGVRVICGEFGVLRTGAPRTDRVRWLHDVRSLLERYDFGWSVWDYSSEAFGLAEPKSGARRVVDRGTLRALGL